MYYHSCKACVAEKDISSHGYEKSCMEKRTNMSKRKCLSGKNEEKLYNFGIPTMIGGKIKFANKFAGKKSNKGWNFLLAVVLGCVLFLFLYPGCMETEAKEKKNSKNDTKIVDLGVLGKDCMLEDLINNSGGQFVFTASFETTTAMKNYVYLFNFRQHNQDGTITIGDIYVKDATKDAVLSALKKASYQDDVVVKMTAIYDKAEVIQNKKGETERWHYYATVTDAEILEKDSYEAKEALRSYYRIGDKIALQNGGVFTIMDAGQYKDQYGEEYAFVKMKIENTGEKKLIVDASDFEFYGDDFVLESGCPSEALENDSDFRTSFSTTLASGRKTELTYFAICPNYDKLERIEVEFGKIVIVIKETVEGKKTAQVDDLNIYGKYFLDNGKNATVDAEVYWASDDGLDWLDMDAWGYGGHEIIPFHGQLEKIGENKYRAYDSDFGTEVTVAFSPKGMKVTVEAAENSDAYCFDGYFEQTSKVDLDAVS